MIAALRRGWRPRGLYRLATDAGTVQYRVVRADPGATTLVVGLHGYGSDERQISTLLGLEVGPVVYLAPRAPLADGDGFSWFGLEVDGRGRVVPGDVRPALERVRAFARAASRAWSTSRTALVGYSQGGALAWAAVSDPGPFDVVAALSGVSDNSAASRTPVPLFVGHGTLDPAAPIEDVRRAVSALEGDVTLHESQAPHVVTQSQRDALSRWLRDRLPSS